MLVPTTSLWEEETFFSPQDFIIVGCGLAGLWSALEIKKTHPAATVTILEAAPIPTGASTRNAGFACFGSPTEMLADAEKMGADKMWSVVAMRYKGLEKIRKNFGNAVIDFDHSGGYECFKHNDPAMELVAGKLDWLNAGMKNICGKNGFTWVNSKLIAFGFSGFGGLIQNKYEGGLHSGKLVQALVQKATNNGIKILCGIKITQWSDAGDRVHLHSDRNTFKASTVIFATNAAINKLNNKTTVQPARGQVLVTAPIANLKVYGTFHFDSGYYYFRNVGNRILLGGARNTDFTTEQTRSLETTAPIQDHLETFLRTHILPGSAVNITHRWSGTMGFSDSKMPHAEMLSSNVVSIFSCNGMGVALTPIIAEEVAALVTASFNLPKTPASLHLP